MNKKTSVVIQRGIAVIGTAFGLLTIFIGGQTLLDTPIRDMLYSCHCLFSIP